MKNNSLEILGKQLQTKTKHKQEKREANKQKGKKKQFQNASPSSQKKFWNI